MNWASSKKRSHLFWGRGIPCTSARSADPQGAWESLDHKGGSFFCHHSKFFPLLSAPIHPHWAFSPSWCYTDARARTQLLPKPTSSLFQGILWNEIAVHNNLKVLSHTLKRQKYFPQLCYSTPTYILDVLSYNFIYRRAHPPKMAIELWIAAPNVSWEKQDWTSRRCPSLEFQLLNNQDLGGLILTSTKEQQNTSVLVGISGWRFCLGLFSVWQPLGQVKSSVQQEAPGEGGGRGKMPPEPHVKHLVSLDFFPAICMSSLETAIVSSVLDET